jgi:hypothetical protein
MENIYYVYVYLNPLKRGKFIYGDYQFDYEPFYVGKGKDRRCYYHLTEKSLIKINNKNKIIKEIIQTDNKPIIEKVFFNLSEIESYQKEIQLIKKIGLSLENKGPLTNLTYGGEGSMSVYITEDTRKKLSECGKKNGYKGKTLEEIHGIEKGKKLREENKLRKLNKSYNILYGKEKSDNIKNKQSKSQKGKKKISDEGKEKLRIRMKNRIVSDETKKKISLSLIGNKRNIGKKHSNETKKKISKSKKGSISHNKYKILQYDKNNIFIKEWDSSTDASKKLKISQGNINGVVIGNRKSAGGFIWIKK